MLAPAARRSFTVSRSLRCAAQCNAVVPSPSVRLTSTCCWRSECTATPSCFRTASDNGTTRGAAAAFEANTERAAHQTASTLRVICALSIDPDTRFPAVPRETSLQIGKPLERERTGAVADTVDADADFVQHADQQI